MRVFFENYQKKYNLNNNIHFLFNTKLIFIVYLKHYGVRGQV